MPEYLSPGVYVEEVSFRSKSIEGVPTSTTGFAGLTRFGPVWSATGPTTCEPRLVTSFTEFERVYGGLDRLQLSDEADRVNYLAHAARAFFLNGGKRLYVSRVYKPVAGDAGGGVSRLLVPISGPNSATWTARWPGRMGDVWLRASVRRSKNIAFVSPPAPLGFGKVQVNRAKAGSIVEIHAGGPPSPALRIDEPPPSAALLAEVRVSPSGEQQFVKNDGSTTTPAAGDEIYLLDLEVTVQVGPDRRDFYGELGAGKDHPRWIGRILGRDHPEDENAAVWLDYAPSAVSPVNLLFALTTTPNHFLGGGSDGARPDPDTVRTSFGGAEADPDVATMKATGLAALGEIDDIAIVAVPDAGDLGDEDLSFAVHSALVAHCQDLRYRIGIVDGVRDASLNAIRRYRGRFDTKYAAMYYPWIEILDPLQRPAQGAPPDRLLLPPSGFVAGIYARSDIERGVHKAPANEVVLGLTRFEVNINKGRNDVLNPDGINALRFFEGRGNRVWGARTMSSDPEWKYVNVRRLFIYLEHSIDKATQWAVFEPNNERLWNNIRRTVEDFLLVAWKDGALMGDKPEKGFFVRADRTTMTQNDLDNGRLIVLVGVAPTYPAEFVIFRIGQWTADAKAS
jgi:phage tail sheath protein FI